MLLQTGQVEEKSRERHQRLTDQFPHLVLGPTLPLSPEVMPLAAQGVFRKAILNRLLGSNLVHIVLLWNTNI